MASDKTLITGATGFVGSAVARVLKKNGYNLRLLVRPTSDKTNIDGLDAEIVYGDLSRPETLTEVFKNVRYLFHVAADYRLWVPDPEAMMRANVEGTCQLMRLALKAGVEKIVYCSSVAALATAHDGIPADETSPVTEDQIVGVYKRSKYRAEQAVLRMVREEKLPVTIVNPSTPIGPRDIKPTPTGQMIWDCVRKRMPAYVDTGLNIVHVDDVAQGHFLALKKGKIGEKYILGGDNIMLKELFNLISREADITPPRIRLDQSVLYPVALISEGLYHLFKIEPRVTREMLAMSKKLMFFSSEKAQKELGYKYRPVGDAVADAVAWFRNKK